VTKECGVEFKPDTAVCRRNNRRAALLVGKEGQNISTVEKGQYHMETARTEGPCPLTL
jgi:hypothetical protein